MQKGIGLIIVLLMLSCSNKEQIYSHLSGNAFGTTYNITFDNKLNRNFSKPLDSLIYVMNKSLSTYIPNSDISKINSGDISVKIDGYFEEVFLKSERIFKETDGYFDPTVGPLVNAWGFGPGNAIANLTQLQVDSLMQFVGFEKVQLVNQQIVKSTPEIYFDFNAIAKGYGIDLIGRYLESVGVKNYLIELGGEIRARGVNSKGDFWRAAIEDPNTDGTRSYSKVISLENQSMASSGNYRKFMVAADGKKYVHTINAKTGYAIESDLLATTVVSSLDCADVDAYATAFMAMGLNRTKAFLKNHSEIKAHLIYIDDNGEVTTFTTQNLKLISVGN